MRPGARSKLWWFAAALLPGAFLAQGFLFLAANSQTVDEGLHLAAGYAYLTRGAFDLNREHPPLSKELAALPVWLYYRLSQAGEPDQSGGPDGAIGRSFLYGSPVPAERILWLARLPNLLLGTALVALIGRWAYRLWGKGAALLALACAAVEPNLLAHSCLVTMDLGVTLFIFLSLYLLWEYLGNPSTPLLVALGIATGLALASKFSALFLPAVVPAILAGHVVCGGALPWPWRESGDGKASLTKGLAAAAVASLVVAGLAAVVVSLVYFGDDFSTWWDGLQFQLRHQEMGHPAFFLGQYSREGWWSYFPVAFLIKTPLGTLALIAASLACLRYGQPFTWRTAACLLLPVALMLAALTQARIDIGLRYALPVYPFLCVAAGRAATFDLRPLWLKGALVGVPLALAAASSLWVAPHQLAYFNELVGGPGEGYRYLSDSNLDWGQDLKGLKAYLDREGAAVVYLSYFGKAPPEYYGIRYRYLPSAVGPAPSLSERVPAETGRELLAISVFNLQGVRFADHDLYGWLGDRQPVAKIGYSIFVYDLTGDREAHRRLAEVCTNSGLPFPAD